MTLQSRRTTFCIPPTHPALPGHFPGRPVVPGVVLLDRVAALIEQAWNLPIGGLPQVKFARPLLPGQQAELVVEDDGKGLRFRIVLDEAGKEPAVIATGSVELLR